MARSNPRAGRYFTFLRLLSNFLIALYRADLCRVLASVCEVKLRLCVYLYAKVGPPPRTHTSYLVSQHEVVG